MSQLFNDNKLIAALDIGTSKTCCVLGYPSDGGDIVIVGAGAYQTKGVKKSEIISLDETTDAVKHAVAAAESHIKEHVKTVVATAPVAKLSSEIIQDKLDLSNFEVSQSDMNRLLSNAQSKIPPSEDEVLHCIPVDYSLDERHSIPDPRGLTGRTLYLSMHTVMCPPFPIRDMNTVLEKSHLDCYKKVASPYMAGLACLTTEEKKQGTAVVDMGAGTTGIGVFYEDQLVFAARLPFGGDQITKAIADSFKTSSENAERIKTLKGSTLPNISFDKEEIEIPLIGEDERVSVYRTTRARVAAVIIPKIEDLFTRIKELLEGNGFMDVCLNFVLTGGGAQLHGVREKAAAVLGKTVRLGVPQRLNDKDGVIPEHAYQSYMNCVGVLAYAAKVLLNASAHQNDMGRPKNKIVRIFRWFLDNC